MAEKYKYVSARWKHHSYTKAEWEEKNPILLRGELGIEEDTKRVKFGDGVTSWNYLGYTVNQDSIDRFYYYGDKEIYPSEFTTSDGDNFTYTVDEATKEITITGLSDTCTLTDIVIPYKKCEIVDGVAVTYTVTAIGEDAFLNNITMASIIIPRSVTAIGERAFSCCGNLINAVIPDSVTEFKNSIFSGSMLLQNVTIPDGVTTIGASAFSDCESLSSVTIPDSVITIGASAFNATKCVIKVPSSVTTFGTAFIGSFCSDNTIVCEPGSAAEVDATRMNATIKYDIFSPDTYATKESQDSLINDFGVQLTNIAYYKDYNDKIFNLGQNPASDFTYEVVDSEVAITGYIGGSDSVIVPAGINGTAVTIIGEGAFKDNTTIKTVSLPRTITSIKSEAFSGCTSLINVDIVESTISSMYIACDAFYNCSLMPQSFDPKGISKGFYSRFSEFYGDHGYVVKYISPSAWFNYEVSSDNTYITITGLSEDGASSAPWVIIPCEINNIPVTAISESAFADNTTINMAIIPDCVTTIGASAFSGCTGLLSVFLPATLSYIRANTFSNCTSVNTIIMPKSGLSAIGERAFYNFGTNNSSQPLNDIYVSAKNTSFGLSIGSEAFLRSNIVNITIDWLYELNYRAFGGCTMLKKVTVSQDSTSTLTDQFPVFDKNDADTIDAADYVKPTASFILNQNLAGLNSYAIEYGLSITYDSIFSGNWETASDAGAKYSAIQMYGLGNTEVIEPTPGSYFTFNGLGTISGLTDEGKALTEIIIPASFLLPITTIDEKAFADCTNLTKVVIPRSVTLIKNEAFSGCTALTAVEICDDMLDSMNISCDAFVGCTSLPNDMPFALKVSAQYNYSDYNVLPYITAKSCFTYETNSQGTKVTITGLSEEGSSLDYLYLPIDIDGIPVTTIGDNAFYENTNITEVLIPNSITYIGEYAFSECTSLQYLELGVNLNHIAMYAFSGCSKMGADNSFTVHTNDSTNTSIGPRAFEGCTGIQNMIITGGVGAGAFSGCTFLYHVKMTESVAQVASGAFGSCMNLKDIVVGNKNTTFSSSALTMTRSDNLVVVCSQDSLAATYAKKYGIPCMYTEVDSSAYVATPTIITATNTDGTLTLADRQDARLSDIPVVTTETTDETSGEVTSTSALTLTLTLPSVISDNYECWLTLPAKDEAITFSYTDGIIWRGVDCDSDGHFAPEIGVNYEIAFKNLGTKDTPNVVARVGSW